MMGFISLESGYGRLLEDADQGTPTQREGGAYRIRGTVVSRKKNEMRITHSDNSQCLQFRWSCVPASGRDQATPRGRSEHASCVLGRHLYVSGGKERYSPLKDFWRLDLVTLEWESIQLPNTQLPHLQGHTMLPYKSQLLIFGGTCFEDDVDNTLLIYNTDLNVLRTGGKKTYQDKPRGCREHSAIIHNGAMYIYGGFTDSSGSINEFWSFNIAREYWERLSGQKPGRRHGHVAVMYHNLMWVHGGMKDLTALSDLWNYNCALRKWNRIKGTGTCPTLSGHSACAVNQCLILIGGTKAGELSQEVWTFNFGSGCWRQILTAGGEFFPPTALHSTVLLQASTLNETVVDRTMSVPQLKATAATVATPVRPWTSPAVGVPKVSGASSSLSNHRVDILHLNDSATALDKNNNSQEDLCSCTNQCQNSLTPLSQTLFQTDSENSPSQKFYQSFLAMENSSPQLNQRPESIELQDFNSDPQSQSQRIRPALSEFCGTGVPLLERFQSVSSEFDLGHDNPTLTLSDEHLSVARLSDMQQKKDLSPCVEENQFDLSPSERTCGATSVLPRHRPHSLDVSKVHNNFEVTGGKNIGSVTSLSQSEVDAVLGGATKTDCDLTGLRFSNPLHKLLYTRSTQSVETDRSTSRRSMYGEELLVEDLELAEDKHFVQSVSIAYPSRIGRRSTSLKDICNFSCESINHVDLESFSQQRGMKQQANSCVDVSHGANGPLVGRSRSRSQSCLYENKENWDIASSSNYRTNPQGLYAVSQRAPKISGKYVKHMTDWSNKVYAPRGPKNVQQFCENSKQSIATQTGSQSSINGTSSASGATGRDHRYDHFISQVVGEQRQEASASETTGNTSQSVPAQCEILCGSELAVLVIGGHRDNQSFHSEPLNLWKLY